MNEKAKNQAASVNKPLFLALWGGSYAAAWMALMLVSRSMSGPSSDEATLLMVAGIFMLIPVTQKLLLRYLARVETRWWLRLSFAGYAIGAWLVINGLFIGSDAMMMAALFVPAGMLQWLILRNRVNSAWLYPGAALVSGLVLVTILPHHSSGSDVEMMFWIALGGTVQGLVTGLTMLMLLTGRREKDKYAPARLTI